MIKAVIFDAGGVLHVSNTAVGEDIQKELGLADDQRDRLFRDYIPLLGIGKITEQQMWDKLTDEFNIRQVSSSERLFQRQFIPTLKKMPGMYELIEGLKAKGIAVMLLTNVSPQFAEVLIEKGHYDPFDVKVLSYEVGLWKPNLDIYRHILQKANLKPEDTVFIDDQEANVVAAESLGIHGIVFKSTEQVEKDLSRLIIPQH